MLQPMSKYAPFTAGENDIIRTMVGCRAIANDIGCFFNASCILRSIEAAGTK
jgi:hypothetical protein